MVRIETVFRFLPQILVLLWLEAAVLPFAFPVRAAAAEPAAREGAESQISQSINGWLKRAELQSCQLGIEVMHLPSGRILFTLNGGRRFVPASTAKIFVTACALDILGGNFEYKTRLQVEGEIKGDRILGNVVISPSQDPSFEFQNLRDLLAVLHQKKIKRIDGNINIAQEPGGSDYFFPGWLAEDWGQQWMPVSSNLVIDRNVAPSGDPGRGLIRTAASSGQDNDSMVNSLLVAPDLAPGWASYEQDKDAMRVIKSSGSSGLVVTNPTAYNLALIRSIVRTMGIRFSESSKKGSGSLTLSEHLSEPLTYIIRHTLRLSDNFYAQQLLRTIALNSSKSRRQSAAILEDRGLQEIQAWLIGIGLKPADVVLVDACGLSRKNCVTPHSLNMVLKHMSGDNLQGPFLDLMKAGGSSSGGSFKFKTGTMDSVRCISGVMRTISGDSLAVSVMINGNNPSVANIRGALGSLTSTLLALPALHLEPSGHKGMQEAAPSKSPPPPKPSAHHRRRRHRSQ